MTFVKANPVCFLATVEDNTPHVRGMQMFKADERGILIQLSTMKDMYKQLVTNPKSSSVSMISRAVFRCQRYGQIPGGAGHQGRGPCGAALPKAIGRSARDGCPQGVPGCRCSGECLDERDEPGSKDKYRTMAFLSPLLIFLPAMYMNRESRRFLAEDEGVTRPGPHILPKM